MSRIIRCLSFLGFARNIVPSMKGDLLSSTFKWLVFSKQKHNDHSVKVIMHYNKHNSVYYIPFHTAYNRKSSLWTVKLDYK